MGELSWFPCGGSMHRLIRYPLKLPGPPSGGRGGSRARLLQPPKYLSVLIALLTRPFCRRPLFNQPVPLGNSQGQAGPGQEEQRGFRASKKSRGPCSSPRPPSTARLSPGTPESVAGRHLHQTQENLPPACLQPPALRSEKAFKNQTPLLNLWGNQAVLVKFFI